uniref:putative ABC transporter permease n=1 Tax=Acetatifactor sp. TaxID=1872090 RepID=UPI0040577962
MYGTTVWGLGCAMFTAFFYKYKDGSDGRIFIAGIVLGGAYEYICSVFTELMFGTVFWDYSGIPFNLGGRINLLYCFFWGIAAVVWLKQVYSRLSALIEKLPIQSGTVITWICIVLMVFNMGISCLSLGRYNERQQDVLVFVEQEENVVTGSIDNVVETNATVVEELSRLDRFLDEYFPDERMERIYPNAKQVK